MPPAPIAARRSIPGHGSGKINSLRPAKVFTLWSVNAGRRKRLTSHCGASDANAVTGRALTANRLPNRHGDAPGRSQERFRGPPLPRGKTPCSLFATGANASQARGRGFESLRPLLEGHRMTSPRSTARNSRRKGCLTQSGPARGSDLSVAGGGKELPSLAQQCEREALVRRLKI
jgi:hypothetical protein